MLMYIRCILLKEIRILIYFYFLVEKAKNFPCFSGMLALNYAWRGICRCRMWLKRVRVCKTVWVCAFYVFVYCVGYFIYVVGAGSNAWFSGVLVVTVDQRWSKFHKLILTHRWVGSSQMTSHIFHVTLVLASWAVVGTHGYVGFVF